MQTRFYVTCFILRQVSGKYEFLQLKRSPLEFMAGTWQLTTGRVQHGESAKQAMLREIAEETSLVPLEFYQLSSLNSYYVDHFDSIVQNPLFCAIVSPDATVTLDHEHTDYRWTPADEIEKNLMWHGERLALAELYHDILGNGIAKPFLRIDLNR